MIDSIIKKRTAAPCKCCICNKWPPRPFIYPAKDIVESLYYECKTVEPLKHLKIFWFCEEHFAFAVEWRNHDFDWIEFDRLVESIDDIDLLKRWDKVCREMLDITKATEKAYYQFLHKKERNDG